MDAPTDSPFLRLPAELRNIVYECTCQDITTVLKNIAGPKSSVPGVFIACKQTHYEGTDIYYRSTTFEFHGINAACTWIKSMPQSRTALIKRVKILLHELNTLDFCSDEDAAKSYYAQQFSEYAKSKGMNLEHLEMDVKSLYSEILWDDMFRRGPQDS